MGRTARVVLVSGSIACLLGLTAGLAGASPAAIDGVAVPPSFLPAPPRASGEPQALRVGEQGLGLAMVIELIVLALTCSVAVAFYRVTTGERGGTRVPARVRRR
ncbi:MAG: hypothetical protein E6K82_04425 [Candidatus Rokuibacteriota bacterium]|nr:MAG: hypothetical protein E6K82_04425 [Candidatus Rokubacteria bacterium]